MEWLLDHHTSVLNTLLSKRDSGKQFAPSKGLDVILSYQSIPITVQLRFNRISSCLTQWEVF